jgi:predicted Zn-dependent protease with MMP-like domain
VSRTRSEVFDDLVLDAVEEVEEVVADDPVLVARLSAIELAVEDIPPDGALADAATAGDLALGRGEAEQGDQPARLVLYRRPIELRTLDAADRARLVHEVVVEYLVDLLDVPLERLDPP